MNKINKSEITKSKGNKTYPTQIKSEGKDQRIPPCNNNYKIKRKIL